MTINLYTLSDGKWILAADSKLTCHVMQDGKELERFQEKTNVSKIVNTSPNTSWMYQGNQLCCTRETQDLIDISEIERRLHGKLFSTKAPQQQAEILADYITRFIDPKQSNIENFDPVGSKETSIISILGFDKSQPRHCFVTLPEGNIYYDDKKPKSIYIGGGGKNVAERLCKTLSSPKEKAQLLKTINRKIKCQKRKNRLIKTVDYFSSFSLSKSWYDIDSEKVRRKMKAFVELLIFFEQNCSETASEENAVPCIGGPVDTQIISKNGKVSYIKKAS